ncbi:MAG: 50S ribosomal protein L11 methyltransferase [Actinomycetota bacterium]
MHSIVDVPAGPDPELTGDRLWVLGAVGVEARDGLLIGSFSDRTAAQAAAAALGGRVRTADDRTGVDAWRTHATWYQVDRFIIRPPWVDAPSVDPANDIVIDPGPTFGSGSHPSTRLAARLLVDVVQPGMSVTDLGAGSGVLSIIAARLGARVTAIDLDPTSPSAVDDNAHRNGVGAHVTAHHRQIESHLVDADVSVLNVTIDIHERVSSALQHQPLGRLIVAGILCGEQEARCAAAHNRTASRRRVDGEWAGVVLDDRATDSSS